ncbi:MAG: hypothetical protein WAU75_24375 [Solirubrobacteraceae bacterium]
MRRGSALGQRGDQLAWLNELVSGGALILVCAHGDEPPAPDTAPIWAA